MLFSSKDADMAELAADLSDADAGDGHSLWRDAMKRFLTHKPAVISLVVLALLILFLAIRSLALTVGQRNH